MATKKIYGDVSFSGNMGSPSGVGGFRAGSVTLGTNTDYAVAIGDVTIEDDHTNGICLGAGTLLAGAPGEYAYGYYASSYSSLYDLPEDGDTLTISDGILPSPVVFEFDDDDSVVETTYLRKIDLTLIGNNIVALHEAVRDAVNASALSITATYSAYSYGRIPTITYIKINEFFHDLQGPYNYPIDLVTVSWCQSVGGMEGGVSPDAAYSGICLGDGDAQATSYSSAMGPGAVAQDLYSIALGAYAGVYATALGDSQDSIAIGDEAIIEDSYYSFALGAFSYVNGAQSVCIGDSSYSYVAKTVAIGVGAGVDDGGAYGSVSIGFDAYAGGDGNVAIGPHASCNSGHDHVVAIGHNAAGDTQSVVIGWDCVGTGWNNFAAGVDAQASDESLAIGLHAVADAKSFAWGRSTSATNYAVALGYQANADHGFAIGVNAQATTYGTVALGYSASATHTDSCALGRDAATTGTNQFVIGEVGTHGMDVICSRGVVLGDTELATAGTLRWNTGAMQVHNGTSWLGVGAGTQVAKIDDPSGGLTVDAEARTAINSIIDALEAYGLSSAT